MRALHPQWSPDGTQLAFQASPTLGAPNKIYLISKDGGVPILATFEGNDEQLYPSWSSNGESILFSSSDQAHSNPALYSLDLKTKEVSILPGSTGLYWGQISPDGKTAAALTYPDQKLVVYDTASRQSRTVAELADYPRWSTDGKYVYFSTLFFARGDAGIYRWNSATGSVDKVLGIPEFQLSGVYGTWFGLTPEEQVLLVRDLSSIDVYALDMDLP